MRFIITSVRFFVFLPPVFLFTSLHFSLVLYSMHCVWVFPWYSSSCLSPQSNLFLYCCCRVFFSFASNATKDRRKKCWEAKKMYKNSQATGKFYVHFIIYTFQMNSIGETTFFFCFALYFENRVQYHHFQHPHGRAVWDANISRVYLWLVHSHSRLMKSNF